MGCGRVNKNSLKGNAAEYLVLHFLLKASIPAWQTGGNNRRWDIIIQSRPNKLLFASVKFAKTRLPIFGRSDEKATRGVYFVVVPTTRSDNWEILAFDSKVISVACKDYIKKSKNQKSFTKRPNFRNFRISKSDYLKGKRNFFQYIENWSKANS